MALLATTVVACDSSSPRPALSPRPTTTTATTPPAAIGCQAVDRKTGTFAAIDYVDFIRAFGRQYIANLSRPGPHISRADLGAVVFRSRCSLARLNDRTHRSPREERDGDTGFLPGGTPVYAVNGWSTQCRLAATHDGRLNVYLAYRNGTRTAQPRDCALHASG